MRQYILLKLKLCDIGKSPDLLTLCNFVLYSGRPLCSFWVTLTRPASFQGPDTSESLTVFSLLQESSTLMCGVAASGWLLRRPLITRSRLHRRKHQKRRILTNGTICCGLEAQDQLFRQIITYPTLTSERPCKTVVTSTTSSQKKLAWEICYTTPNT